MRLSPSMLGRRKSAYSMLWWARLDSNQEPTDYESAALTVELRAPRFPYLTH